MKAKRVLVPEKNKVILDEIEIPDHPSSEQVTIKTEYSFISAGTELAAYTALTPSVYQPGAWNAYPWASGYSNVGRITAVGKDVDGFAEGDRVFCFGKHQSIHHVHPFGEIEAENKADSILAKVPDGLAPDIAASCRMALVAMSAVCRTKIQINDNVAVWGLGMVGNLACQLYSVAGCRVIGIDPISSRRQKALEVGVDAVLDSTKEEVLNSLTELTADSSFIPSTHVNPGTSSGHGIDIAVDAVGEAALLEQACLAVKPNGQVISLGSPRRDYHTNTIEVSRRIHFDEIKLGGGLEWGIPRLPISGVPYSTLENLQKVFDLATRGKIHLSPLISHRISPSEIESAYQGLLDDKDIYTGVALDWSKI